MGLGFRVQRSEFQRFGGVPRLGFRLKGLGSGLGVQGLGGFREFMRLRAGVIIAQHEKEFSAFGV